MRRDISQNIIILVYPIWIQLKRNIPIRISITSFYAYRYHSNTISIIYMGTSCRWLPNTFCFVFMQFYLEYFVNILFCDNISSHFAWNESWQMTENYYLHITLDGDDREQATTKKQNTHTQIFVSPVWKSNSKRKLLYVVYFNTHVRKRMHIYTHQRENVCCWVLLHFKLIENYAIHV